MDDLALIKELSTALPTLADSLGREAEYMYPEEPSVYVALEDIVVPHALSVADSGEDTSTLRPLFLLFESWLSRNDRDLVDLVGIAFLEAIINKSQGFGPLSGLFGKRTSVLASEVWEHYGPKSDSLFRPNSRGKSA